MKDATLIVGALSGIGKQLVLSMAEREKGSSIILADLPAREMELRHFSNIEAFSSLDLIPIPLDVRDTESTAGTLSESVSRDYRVKRFVYLVGTNKLRSAHAITEEIWDDIFDLNIKGFFFTAQCVSAFMMQHEGGSMVGIASQHGVAPNKERAAYCASKAGLIHLSEALALEWAKYNIRVNMVSPTFIVTEGNAQEVETDAFRNRWLNKVPLHRFATPKDVSDAVLFLLSEQSQLITGHNLVVDGGWLLNRCA